MYRKKFSKASQEWLWTMQSLIAWLNGFSWTPAFDHSPALNRPCLRAWTQLTYFFSLSLPVQSSLFTLLWAEFLFISPSVQNAKGVSINSEWLSYLFCSFVSSGALVFHVVFNMDHIFQLYFLILHDFVAWRCLSNPGKKIPMEKYSDTPNYFSQ